MKTAFTTTILYAALVAAWPQEPSPPISAVPSSREGRWKEDLEYFARELPARHLDFHKLIPKKDFDREVRKLERNVHRLSDVEMVFGLMRLGARVGVAHTWVGYPPEGPTAIGYPIMLHWFSDGLAVIAATPEYREILGAQVVEIGPVTSRQAVAKVAPYISHENQAWLYRQSPLWFRNVELLKHLKIAKPDGRVRVTVIAPDAKTLSMDVLPAISGTPTNWVTAWDALGIPPVLRRKQHLAYWYELLPDLGVLYVKYSACVDLSDRPFAAFAEEVLSVADSNAVRRVIVDLRANGGGANSIVMPLVAGLKSRPNLRGKDHLCILIDSGTFSAGADAAVALRNEAGGMLVGQPTGAKPNFYAESPHFVLPHSKMEVHYCTKFYRLAPEGDPSSLEPDLPAPFSLKDFLAGRDPALEAALARFQ